MQQSSYLFNLLSIKYS